MGENMTKKILSKLISIIMKERRKIAVLESKDTNKPLEQSLSEVDEGLNILRYFENQEIVWKINSISGSIQRYPLGTCLFILPFNYPFLLSCWKIAPCLATNNICWIKPSPHTPNSIKYVAEKLNEPEFLQVFNLNEDETIRLINNVDHVGFIGGDIGARAIWNASYGKSVSIEASGCNPLIIGKDFNFDLMNIVADAILTNAGQNCCKPSLIFVPKSIYEKFEISLCNFCEKYPIIPLSNEVVFDKFNLDTKNLELHPAVKKIVVKSQFLQNHVFSTNPILYKFNECIEDKAPLFKEIFGPTTTLILYDNLTEVLKILETNKYKLALGVFSSNTAWALDIISKLKYGMNWINAYNNCPPDLSFGGSEFSGTVWSKDLGRQSMYCLTKQISVYNTFIDTKRNGNDRESVDDNS
eukprot:NODE_1030_length_2533_cov_1.317584.p1 type:complete len:413 gc:universal NODE_1030_length_2533_cov_1.317584:523-1761(+)